MPSQKERGIGAVRCEKEGMSLQPLRWRCAERAVHHERNVREEHPIYVARTSNNRVIMVSDLNS